MNTITANNTKVLYKAHPDGLPNSDKHFEIIKGKIDLEKIELIQDKLLVYNLYIPVCGMISQYNKSKQSDGIHNLTQIIGKRIRLEGFIVSDRMDLYPKAFEIFGKYLSEGKMKYKEHITEGIENLPAAFIDMLEGRNFGKTSVKIADL